MTQHARFLGFAFANADFLFEVDASGAVAFCAGESAGLADGAAPGTPAAALFDPTLADAFRGLVSGLATGKRHGPVACTMKNGSGALLSLFRLSENGERVSCTLSR